MTNANNAAESFIFTEIKKMWPMKEPGDLLHTSTDAVWALMFRAFHDGRRFERERMGYSVEINPKYMDKSR